MKILMALILILGQQVSLAGKVDFDSLITDAQASKKEFTQEVKKNLGHQEQKPRGKVVYTQSKDEVESIMAPSKPLKSFDSGKEENRTAKKLEKKNFERISQEMKQVTE